MTSNESPPPSPCCAKAHEQRSIRHDEHDWEKKSIKYENVKSTALCEQVTVLRKLWYSYRDSKDSYIGMAGTLTSGTAVGGRETPLCLLRAIVFLVTTYRDKYWMLIKQKWQDNKRSFQFVVLREIPTRVVGGPVWSNSDAWILQKIDSEPYYLI